MGTQMRNVVLALVVAGLVVGLGAWNAQGWYPVAGMFGRAEAERDVRHGRLRVLGYGRTNLTRTAEAKMLRLRYGIEFEDVAGCVVSKAEIDYAAAYNAVSDAAIRRRFGRDVVRESWAAAEAGEPAPAARR